MIRLYLVRHGIAADAAASDASRALTNKGRRRFRKTARAFGRREKVDLILTSPLVRAVQTAEILAGEGKHGETLALEELAPGHSVPALLAAVAKAAGKKRSVALVGHDPQLTNVLAALARLPAQKLDFRKGAIVRLDVSGLPQAKGVSPRWWLKPRSGAMRMGLPLTKQAATAVEAAKRAASARPARKIPKRRAASVRVKPPERKQAAKTPPKRAAATAPRAPAKASAAAPSSPPSDAPPTTPPKAPPAAAPQRQTFMGSPRPIEPASPPAPGEPARPPEGDGV
jgi:phosphohistidine phosphatase